MEINPYDSRLRMLQQIDTVAMQREAAPDEETAGCPGCPYFWTCPVPHRGEEVRAPQELTLEDAADALPVRRAFVPRDESDVGFTDVWLDEEGLPLEAEEAEELRRAQSAGGEGPEDEERLEAAAESDEGVGRSTPADLHAGIPAPDTSAPARRRRWWRRGKHGRR